MHPESVQRSVDEQEAKIKKQKVVSKVVDLEDDDDEEDDLEEEEGSEDEEDDDEDGDESVEVLEPGILKSNHTKAKIMHPQSVKRSADEQEAGKSKKQKVEQKVVDLEEEEDSEDEDLDEEEDYDSDEDSDVEYVQYVQQPPQV